MRFKRLFFDNSIDFRTISISRWVVSIVLGLLSSVIIYFTFSVLIDGFRLVFSDLQNIPLLTSQTNRNSFNLFFASLSLIFGNSIFISLLLSRPSSVFSRGNTKKFRIFNEQVVLNGFFMTWFGKMAIVFGSFSFIFLDFEILSDYLWVIILLVLVMYLETWKTLLQVLGKRKYRLLSIHFLIFIVFSFGLSKIDISNSKKLDSVLLNYIPTYNLPDSYFNSSSKNLYRYPFIEIGLKLDKNENIIIRTEDRESIQLSELGVFLINERNKLPEELIPRIIVILSIDKDMKLKYIKSVEAELFINSYYKVWYKTNNPDSKAKRYLTSGFTKRLNESILDFKDKNITPSDTYKDAILRSPPPPSPPPVMEEYYVNKTITYIEIDDKIKLNNKIVNEEEIVKAFETKIDSLTVFYFSLNPETSFQNYITVLSSHLKAVENLRQKHASSGFNISKPRYEFTEEEYKELSKLKEKFPTAIHEFNK